MACPVGLDGEEVSDIIMIERPHRAYREFKFQEEWKSISRFKARNVLV